MPLSVAFKSKAPFEDRGGVPYGLWTYEVTLDGSVAEDVDIGLGFSAQLDIRDPADNPAVAELQGMRLKKPGSELQFVSTSASRANAGVLDLSFVAPAVQDAFTALTLVKLDPALGTTELLPFRVQPAGPDNSVQILVGPGLALAPADQTPAQVLPYASEPFGIYQPLIGWRSALHRDRISLALANRFVAATRSVGDMARFVQDNPVGTLSPPHATDRTGTQIGQQLAVQVRGPADNPDEWQHLLDGDAQQSALLTIARHVVAGLEQQVNQVAVDRRQRDGADLINREIVAESATATLLHYLGQSNPNALAELFRTQIAPWQRIAAAINWFSETHPARAAFLSPIGLLHSFREYFFELGTFLGPPVGHVWLSPGGSVELIEVNTRRVLVEQTIEQSTETIQKTELDQTDQDELSDAVKVENATDTKLGVTATTTGGVPAVFQASGTGSFNIDVSRKQAQEQTHKRMREQSSKLSSEVRQNYKTTFRTVTETTDTSSRRYSLQNTTDRLVSYELSRKMRKVAVQIQDLGLQLCWQLFVDNPGDTLGLGEFVHATSAALDPGVKPPDYQPTPGNQDKTYSLSVPFVLYQGADSDATDTYSAESGNPDHGIFSPDAGKDDIILFRHTFTCPAPPAGYELSSIGAIDFHGAEVQFTVNDPDLAPNPDVANNRFTIRLTHANFGGQHSLPFDATLTYTPSADTLKAVNQANAALKSAYDDQVAIKKEQLFFDTLRTRLKLVGQVKPRPEADLRDEERSIIYRRLIAQLYGNEAGWSNEDYHVASELIRYFFDVDAMLYFVAPDWWRPRQQSLSSMDTSGELQATIIADPAISERVERIGKYAIAVRPGHRPYYLITEDTQPAPMGASLGWLIQLDGDPHRNAFLNSPWVKAVLPIRPGRERDAIAWLRRDEVAGSDGLAEPYPFDAAQDPPEYAGQTIEQVLLMIADKIAAENQASLTPTPVDPGAVNPQLALPTETVFTHGFDPLEGGINFGSGAFKVFSQWLEILPTDQVVATEYRLTGL